MNKEEIRGRYDVLAERYERHYTNPRSILSLEKVQRAKILEEHLKHINPAMVLDLGCGAGYVAVQVKRILPTACVIGIDLSTGMLSVAKSKYGSEVTFIASDAVFLPVAQESFDVVYALGVFEKFDSLDHLLDEIGRVLRPGGNLLFSYPNRYSLPMYIRRIGYLLRKGKNTPSNRHWLTAGLLKTTLKRAGLFPHTRLYITYGNSIITFPWSKAVSIGMERLVGANVLGSVLAMSTVWMARKG